MDFWACLTVFVCALIIAGALDRVADAITPERPDIVELCLNHPEAQYSPPFIQIPQKPEKDQSRIGGE